MIDGSFDDLSAIWASASPGQDSAKLLARSVAAQRRAQIAEKLELLVAVGIGCAIILGEWSHHSSGALVVGGMILALLLWSSRVRFRLRRVEWLTADGNREAFLAAAITRLRARTRRATWSAVLLLPAAALGVVFAAISHEAGIGDIAARLRLGVTLTGPVTLGAAVLAATLVALIIRIRRHRRELDRLTAIQASYHEEAQSDFAG